MENFAVYRGGWSTVYCDNNSYEHMYLYVFYVSNVYLGILWSKMLLYDIFSFTRQKNVKSIKTCSVLSILSCLNA